jgi:hypothetical protein
MLIAAKNISGTFVMFGDAARTDNLASKYMKIIKEHKWQNWGKEITKLLYIDNEDASAILSQQSIGKNKT